MIHRAVLRPVLFRMDPERAHDLAVGALSAASPLLARLPGVRRDPRVERRVMGIRFPTPVGLAAGFDKSARAVAAWPAVGFGFAEIGTVTALPQPGNPRPRIFRLPDDGALVNRLGFNNDGAEAVALRLGRARRRGWLGRIPLGVNIGKSKVTDLADAPGDYLRSFTLLSPFADYVVVNVSSPNTPGLRELQDAARLEEILATLLAAPRGRDVPLLVKLAPDLADAAVDEAVDMALGAGIAGVVVTNTTLSRDGLRSAPALTAEQGGLSGRPLRDRSTALVARVADRAAGRLAVVGVGGVFDAADAWAKLAAGAALVQVYTGFVYGGAGLPRRIASGIAERLSHEGVATVDDIPRA